MPAGARCLNCGAALDGRFCRDCGQDRTLVLRPLRDLLSEWAEAALGWESRTGRTLRALLLEPGRLTVEFAAGRRAGWLHPLRLYLGVSVVALTVFGATTDQVAAYLATQDGTSGTLSVFGQLMLLISTLMFMLMPAHAVTYAIAFRSLRRYYVEHLVMVLHATAFLFIAEAAASLLQYVGVLIDAPFWSMVAVRFTAHILAVVYGFRAVRRVYGLDWWPTLWRTSVAVALFAPMFVGAVSFMLRLRG